jgi:hypothetical protein
VKVKPKPPPAKAKPLASGPSAEQMNEWLRTEYNPSHRVVTGNLASPVPKAPLPEPPPAKPGSFIYTQPIYCEKWPEWEEGALGGTERREKEIAAVNIDKTPAYGSEWWIAGCVPAEVIGTREYLIA